MNLISENNFNSHYFHVEFFFKDYDSSPCYCSWSWSICWFLSMMYQYNKTSVSSALTRTCFHHEWYSKAILAIVVYQHLQHTGTRFGINDYSIQWLLDKTNFAVLVIQKPSSDFTHFSSDVKLISDKTLPLLFVCYISFVEGPLPQQSNTT